MAAGGDVIKAMKILGYGQTEIDEAGCILIRLHPGRALAGVVRAPGAGDSPAAAGAAGPAPGSRPAASTFPLASASKCPIIVDRYPSAVAAAVPLGHGRSGGPGEVGLTAFRPARKGR